MTRGKIRVRIVPELVCRCWLAITDADETRLVRGTRQLCLGQGLIASGDIRISVCTEPFSSTTVNSFEQQDVILFLSSDNFARKSCARPPDFNALSFPCVWPRHSPRVSNLRIISRSGTSVKARLF
jgi:hypothetical protein